MRHYDHEVELLGYCDMMEDGTDKGPIEDGKDELRSIEELDGELDVQVKIRYRGLPARAVISNNEDRVIVRFRTPQKAVTPGQLAVFYQGDVVVGGAWIDRIPNG